MDPITVSAIVLGSIALVTSIVSNLRIRSRCRAGDVLDISVQKRFNEDLGTEKQIKQLQDYFTSTSEEESSTD